MRVIAGNYRGKMLKTPDGLTTRPTSDRAKEGLFNMLSSYLRKNDKSWNDISFLDAFAGSGAMGIEALSRGAKEVILVEKDRKAQEAVLFNLQKIKGNIRLIKQDILNFSHENPFDMVFLDAPYGKGLEEKALLSLFRQGLLTETTLCILETETEVVLPDIFEKTESRSFGRPLFTFVKVKKAS